MLFESLQLNDIKDIFSMWNAIFLYFFLKKGSIIILNSAYFVMTLNLKKKIDPIFQLTVGYTVTENGWMDFRVQLSCFFVFVLFLFFCWVWLIMYSIHYIISIFMSAFLQPFCLNSKLFYTVRCLASWVSKKFYFPIFNMNLVTTAETTIKKNKDQWMRQFYFCSFYYHQ